MTLDFGWKSPLFGKLTFKKQEVMKGRHDLLEDAFWLQLLQMSRFSSQDPRSHNKKKTKWGGDEAASWSLSSKEV